MVATSQEFANCSRGRDEEIVFRNAFQIVPKSSLTGP